MNLTVDRDVCVGAGMCVLTAPDTFDQDDTEGRVLILGTAPLEDHTEAIREAATLCPSGAITLTED